MAARQWTEEQRQRQREAIQRWKPWAQSTGPRTAEGKAKASRNGDKGGLWAEVRDFRKEINQLLREQRELLQRVLPCPQRVTEQRLRLRPQGTQRAPRKRTNQITVMSSA